MNEDSNGFIPKDIIPDKLIFRKSYLSRTKTNYSFFNNKKKDIIDINKIVKLNPKFKPLSKKNIIKIKLLHSKFLSKNNNDSSSLLKSSNLSCIIKDDRKNNGNNINNKKLNKTIFLKLTPKLNNNKEDKIDNSFLTNRLKIKKYNISNILKKSNSCEALINKNTIFNNYQNEELALKNKKNELKKKLKKDMQKHFIIDKATLQKYNLLFKIGLKRKTNTYIEGLKNDPDEAINKNNLYNTNNSFDNKSTFRINNYYNSFSVFKSTFRYEDYYFTPLEFLNKYFNKNDIMIMKSFPAYFGLNKSPFKEADLIFKPTLLQKIQYEEKVKNKKKNKIMNIKSFYLNRNIIKMVKSKSENKKIYKKKFKFQKINSINNNNLKILKFNPFIPNYEREIEPNEGTEEYFKQKYEKYLKNKKMRIKRKIENNNYKKSKFEFLKNEHVQKMNSELEIQRISRPILETIRKNYIISNYLIKHPKKL